MVYFRRKEIDFRIKEWDVRIKVKKENSKLIVIVGNNIMMIICEGNYKIRLN